MIRQERNPQSLADREQLWDKEVMPRIAIKFKLHEKSKALQEFKDFYLYQKEQADYEPEYDLDWMPVVVRLWLLPDHSVDNWTAILRSMLKVHGWEGMAGTVQGSFRFLCQAGGVDYTGYYNYPESDLTDGYFMGTEQKLVDFFVNHLSEIVKTECGEDGYLMFLQQKETWPTDSGIMWIKETININRVCCFLVPEYIRGYHERNESFYTRNPNKKARVVEYLYSISHYDEFCANPPEIEDDVVKAIHNSPDRVQARQAFIDQLYHELETQELADYLARWWHIAKTRNSLAEAQKRADPVFKEPEPEPAQIPETPKERMLRERAERETQKSDPRKARRKAKRKLV